MGGPQLPFPPGFLPPLEDDDEREWYEEINEKFGTPEKANLKCVVVGPEQPFPINLK
jgi:hypothetical protein